MKFTADVKYLNRESKQGIKDPTKTYHNVLVMQGADAPTFSCDEQVYNRLDGLKETDPIVAVFEYNAQYRSVKLIDFQPKK